MPLLVATLAAIVVREPFTAPKKVGFGLILIGVLGIVWGTGGNDRRAAETSTGRAEKSG